jgi:hypothetical protein
MAAAISPASPSAVARLWPQVRRGATRPGSECGGERIAGRVHVAQRGPRGGKLGEKRERGLARGSGLEDRGGLLLPAAVGKRAGQWQGHIRAKRLGLAQARNRGLRTARPRQGAAQIDEESGVLRFPPHRFREGRHGLTPLAQRRLRRAHGMHWGSRHRRRARKRHGLFQGLARFSLRDAVEDGFRLRRKAECDPGPRRLAF